MKATTVENITVTPAQWIATTGIPLEHNWLQLKLVPTISCLFPSPRLSQKKNRVRFHLFSGFFFCYDKHADLLPQNRPSLAYSEFTASLHHG
jgi:hypothetical protein